MKVWMAAALGALALSACGGGGPADKFAQACVKKGVLSKEVCECAGREQAKNLPPAALAAFELQADGKMDEANKAIGALSLSDRMSAAQVQAAAMVTCAKK